MRKAMAVVLLSCLGAPSFAADDVARLVELMAKVGFASSPSFSPDGKTLAFVSNVSGLPQVWTVPVAGGYPELVTAFDDPVGAVRWSPDGQWLAFSLAPGGGMNAQVYVVKPNGTGVRMLTAGGKSNHFMGDWSRDGKSITLSSNRRTPEAMDAYYVDAEGRHRLVAENRGVGTIADTSRDGRLALLSRAGQPRQQRPLPRRRPTRARRSSSRPTKDRASSSASSPRTGPPSTSAPTRRRTTSPWDGSRSPPAPRPPSRSSSPATTRSSTA